MIKTPKKEPTLTSLYMLIQEALKGKYTVEELTHKLSHKLNISSSKDDVLDLLADAFVQCDIETTTAVKDQRDTLLSIIEATIKAGLLPASLALERFEIDTNSQIGIIADKKQFTVSYNRLRTKLYFKQKKYNLLREENEGFAKILTRLSDLTDDNVQDILTSIIEIIGRYRVDPNRVLDLMLEVLEFKSRQDYQMYIDLINSFYNNSQKITQLIILKLSLHPSNFRNHQAVNQADGFKILPQSLYRLIAILLHEELVDFDEIYAQLTPSDSKILEHHKKLVEEARAYARKYAMAVVGEEKQPNKTVMESLSDEDRHILEIDNQKINICSELINIGDWDQAIFIARKLPEFYCFSDRRVALAACDLINYLIDPIYRDCALPKPLNERIQPLPYRKIALKQVTTVEELQTTIFPMLTALGPFLRADTLVLTKILRVLRYVQPQQQADQDGPDKRLTYQILDVLNDSIFPAISLSGSNSFLARELWQVVKNFKYHIRYKLYHNWKEEGSNPVMLRNRGQTLLRAKHHMKRLSKETLRLTGRHIGKLCYSNPVITLNYILIQIQSYDNLIPMVVDAMKFLPPIGLDVLIYCIIEALLDPHKNKKSFDGMALAQWLISLSSFSANIILRYKVEFTGFLEYIAFQLRAGSSLDPVLLTDLIQKMTGIETIQAITDERIEALMGGDILRTECAYFNQAKNTRKPSARLKDALIESRLAMPLCILMAQLRDSLFFNQKDGTPLKLIGKLYDQCQETLVQYGVFLSTNLSIDDYINFLPSLEELMTEYKLDPDSAFFLARPMIFHKIKSRFVELREAAAKDLQVEEGEAPELSFQTLGIKFVEAARSVINPIAEAIRPSLIEKYGTKLLRPKIFVIFWTLSMCDIEVPTSCYEREIQRLKTALSELSKSNDDDPKRRKERERCSSLIHKLKQEQAEQAKHVAYVRMYLESEKNNLFLHEDDDSGGYDGMYKESRQFVQHCIFARSILTASDAIYSSRFLLFLQELKVENYPTIVCQDRLLCDITYKLGACTENEANHCGRFLCNILKTVAHWHQDEATYKEEVEGSPGSIINSSNTNFIDYAKYRELCFKWHYRLTRSFTIALESNNYIQIRNALIVMISIIDHYPAIKHFGKGIGMKIDLVRSNEKEKRPDLYALATAYAGKLEDKKPYLLPETSFHAVNEESKNSKSSSNSTTPKEKEPSTPKNSTTNHSDQHHRSSSSSRPSSKTRPASPNHRERHSSSSSRKKARH